MGDVRTKASSARASWISSAVVIGLALLFGLFVLPRLAPGIEGKPAPDFALPVQHGGEVGGRVRLSEQRGKLVVLDFWASWCRPCREQTQVLETVRRRYADRGLVVLGVNVNDAPAAARAYLEKVKPSYVSVEDIDGEAYAAYEIQTLPTIVAITRDGNVFAIRRRFVPERELSAMIEGMLE